MVAPLGSVVASWEKSGTPTRPRSGVRMSATNELITAAKAMPITNATARSTTLPRMMNSRNPVNMAAPSTRARHRSDGVTRQYRQPDAHAPRRPRTGRLGADAPRHLERELPEGPPGTGAGLDRAQRARRPLPAGDEALGRPGPADGLHRPGIRAGAPRPGPMERRGHRIAHRDLGRRRRHPDPRRLDR